MSTLHALAALLIGSLASPASLSRAALERAHVDPAVEQALRDGADTTYVVVMLRDVPLRGLAELEVQMGDVAEVQDRVLRSLADRRFRPSYLYRTFPGMAGWVDAAGLDDLRRHPDVVSITPDYEGRAHLVQSREFVGAALLNRVGLTGTGRTVAVIDSGIDTDHPDLAANVAPGAYHFLQKGTVVGPGAEDDAGHGTGVSGVIASAGVVAPAGVAPDAQILAVKVLSNGSGFLSDWAAGVDYVTSVAGNYQALVAINMSLGTFNHFSACPCDGMPGAGAALKAAVDAAKAAGIVVFSASGNDASCVSEPSPSCLDSVTSVTAVYDRGYGREPDSGTYGSGCFDATTQADQVTCFTNRSPCNVLAAPGRYIYAPSMGGGAATWTGTSFAGPHCAGVAALIDQVADLTPDDLVQLLLDTGWPTLDPCLSTPNPIRIDAQAALCAIAPQYASDALRRADKISDTAGGFTGGLADGDQFGLAIVSPGDLNGDGVPDLIAGAPTDDDGGPDRGALWVLFLASDRSVSAHQKISSTQGGFPGALADGDELGTSLASLGDLSGDGTLEVAVGSRYGSGTGEVWILSLQTNGTVAAGTRIASGSGGFTGTPAAGSEFGTAVAALSDLDGNGVRDLAVGAMRDPDGGPNRGAVWVLFLDTAGTVIGHQKISSTTGGLVGPLDDTDLFGRAVAELGDLDGDGVMELAVGAMLDDSGATDAGAVYLLSLGSDGVVLNERRLDLTTPGLGGLQMQDRFGGSLAPAGDLNGDGVPDLLVGAMLDDDGGDRTGAVWCLVLDSNADVLATRRLGPAQCELTGRLDHADIFSRGLATLPGSPGGGTEIAVGANLDDDGGTDRGAVWLLGLRRFRARTGAGPPPVR